MIIWKEGNFDRLQKYPAAHTLILQLNQELKFIQEREQEKFSVIINGDKSKTEINPASFGG